MSPPKGGRRSGSSPAPVAFASAAPTSLTPSLVGPPSWSPIAESAHRALGCPQTSPGVGGCFLSLLLIDDQGEFWDQHSPVLRSRLRASIAGGELRRFAVLNLGF